MEINISTHCIKWNNIFKQNRLNGIDILRLLAIIGLGGDSYMCYLVGRKINEQLVHSDTIIVKINAMKDVLNDNYLFCNYCYIPKIKDFYRRKEMRFEFEIRKVNFSLQNVEERLKIEHMFNIINRLAEVYTKFTSNIGQKVLYNVTNEELEYYKNSLDKFMYHDIMLYSAKATSLEEISSTFLELTGHEISAEKLQKLIINAY